MAGAFFAAGAFLAGAFLAGAFLAGAFLAGAFLAGDVAFFAAAAAFFAGAVAFFAAGPAALATALGSFLAPDTTFFRSWPGVNFGTDFFLAFMRAPVWGLRTQRASRTRFSNEPKPVIATFSPFATSRVIVSSTESRAWAACFRLPSKRADSVSMSCDLFTDFPSNERRGRAFARLLLGKLGIHGAGHNDHAGAHSPYFVAVQSVLDAATALRK